MLPLRTILFTVFFFLFFFFVIQAQDYDNEDDTPHIPAEDNCNGIFLTYTFISRTKEYPHVKNATAQSYAFKSTMTILNAMTEDLKTWQVFVGFQYEEILVSASGAITLDGTDFPAHVGNGTTFAGYPQADLLNSIDTAGDMTQIKVKVDLTGTQFGVKPPAVPLPKSIKLVNDGFKCPSATRQGSMMYTCCVKDNKFKIKKPTETKFLPRMYGDLTISYDIIQAYPSNYLAQVTIDNNSPLGRLDNWNLTWEWKRGEFINNMRGAYTFVKDGNDCLYGPQATYYQDLDFSAVMNCERKPIITDLPPDRANDSQVGKIPNCCKNGSLLSPIMDPSKAKAAFQLQVYKIPPDLNRTALNPPSNFKINGYLNPSYRCGPAIRVNPTEFPDPSGLMAKSYAVASWQISCNITKPEKKKSRCCVSFSAFYNDSVVPCSTCACGCPEDGKCNPNKHALLLPPEALLIPAENRTAKARAWAEIKHLHVPNPMPCWDNCRLSMNWHVNSNSRDGWTVRITLFNWAEYVFKDWFAAIVIPKAYRGFDTAYSLNGTKVQDINDTIFLQGLQWQNFLLGETDGKNPLIDPRVPGKQQSVISFKKKNTTGIDILKGDGFPVKVYFDGEECALPDGMPSSSHGYRASAGILPMVLTVVSMVFLLMNRSF